MLIILLYKSLKTPSNKALGRTFSVRGDATRGVSSCFQRGIHNNDNIIIMSCMRDKYSDRYL